MKKILASILAAALVLCGAAVAEAEMEPLAQNISAGGIAAVGAEGELYFSLNGLQRMNAEGGVETLFEGEVSRLQYVDGALYFVGSEAAGEYGDESIETPYRMDADGSITAIGAPLRCAEASDYGDACLTSCDTFTGYREMTVYNGHIYYIGNNDVGGEYETIAEDWGGVDGETRYTTRYEHGQSVFRMDLDGGNKTELISGLGNSYAHMAVSNDRIAVSSCYRNGVFAYDFTNFMLYDLDGKLLKVVSNPTGNALSLRMEGQAFTVIVDSIRTDGENIYASLSDSEGDFANSRLVNVENINEDILIEAWYVPALWHGDELIYLGSDAKTTFWDECMETTTRLIRRDAAGNETVLAYLPADRQTFAMTTALLGDMVYLRTGEHLLRVNLANGDVDEFNGTEFAVCAACDPAYASMPQLVLTTPEPEDEVVEESEYLLPDSDTRLYSKEELKQYDKDTLALMRNEILARHGYPFKKEQYQTYFGSKSWYTADPNFDYNCLNSIEMANVETIKGLEG